MEVVLKIWRSQHAQEMTWKEEANNPSQSQENKIEDMQHEVGDPNLQSDSSTDVCLHSPDEHLLSSTSGKQVKCESKYSTVIEFSIGLPVILSSVEIAMTEQATLLVHTINIFFLSGVYCCC